LTGRLSSTLGRESSLQSFVDLRQGKKRFINRQRGSGIRWFIAPTLRKTKIKPAQIKGYDSEAWTHWEVGLAVLRRQADIGAATESVARVLGLTFHPLSEERLDLVAPKDYYFTKSVQGLLSVLVADELKTRAAAHGGYDVRETWSIVFPE
jgi:putative molybdopterin biosynthesis protein